ncbi:MAG TPA: signal peptidase I [Candidatus Saccharimonadales bacterium]|nr:signal peptidase I [Candidatus Saccharimonadales bacterium]
MEHIKIPDAGQEPKEPASGKPKVKQEAKRELFSTLAVLIIAPIIAILLTAFVFQSYQVDGPSMENTLHNNDRLIVTKLGKTWSRLTGGNYIPDRYSIVIFNYNGGFEVENKQLIKRVIGLPGDRVVVQNGAVTIYNEEHPGGFNPDTIVTEAPIVSSNKGEADVTLKEGELFVMGDNRGNSLDSREFGPISSQDIVGHLSVRIFPFDSIKKF